MKTGTAVNKSKKNRIFPTFEKLGVGSGFRI
jgi:hypothetical protein